MILILDFDFASLRFEIVSFLCISSSQIYICRVGRFSLVFFLCGGPIFKARGSVPP